MRDHVEDFERAGAGLAAVGLGDLPHARAFRERSAIAFPILVDERRRAYRVARLRSAPPHHVLRRDNRQARARAQAAGLRQGRLGKNPFQLGGSFVFGPGDRDLYAHLAATYGDNATVADLLAALAAG